MLSFSITRFVFPSVLSAFADFESFVIGAFVTSSVHSALLHPLLQQAIVGEGGGEIARGEAGGHDFLHVIFTNMLRTIHEYCTYIRTYAHM